MESLLIPEGYSWQDEINDCFAQMRDDVGDLVHYSTHLSKLLSDYGFDAEYREKHAADTYAEARILAEPMPLAKLAIYVAAFADALEEMMIK
jgi:hypothetical protein